MTEKYDKDGTLMTLEEWGTRMEDSDYKRVDETTLPDGTWISTVWLGLDHQWGDGPPLIFETMVFPKSDLIDEDMDRYSTEEAARVGHQKMVEKWAAL